MEKCDNCDYTADKVNCPYHLQCGQPSALSAGSPLDVLRSEQAAAVMPLIGGLLDHWDQIANDLKDCIREESPAFGDYIEMIRRRMER